MAKIKDIEVNWITHTS